MPEETLSQGKCVSTVVIELHIKLLRWHTVADYLSWRVSAGLFLLMA